MNSFKQFSPDEIKHLLMFLNLDKKPNASGEIVTNSPFREDNKPSFSINIHTGLWKDFGEAGREGNIVSLFTQLYNIDFNTALERINEIVGFYDKKYLVTTISSDGRHRYYEDSDLIFPPDHEQSKTLSSSLDEKPIKKEGPSSELSEYNTKQASVRLNQGHHSLLEDIQQYDLLKRETLLKYGCGVISHYDSEWLSIPYYFQGSLCGVQLYRRRNGGKAIQMLRGSKPSRTFFGTEQLTGKSTLFIAKSPREAMLLNQDFGDYLDVISIVSGESATISETQEQILHRLNGTYSSIKVLFDCDTDDAHGITKRLTENVRRVLR